MRINRYVALCLGISRRMADELVVAGRVAIDGAVAEVGSRVKAGQIVTVNGKPLVMPAYLYIMLNKPTGYLTSQRSQGGAPTIYDLLPPEYRRLKTAGRLDKDSSGLLILSNDGAFIDSLTHPSKGKEKAYEVKIDKDLSPEHKAAIEHGVALEDGLSSFGLAGQGKNWTVSMQEGRNRQIRRTFRALGYTVKRLHRTRLGPYELHSLPPGELRTVDPHLSVK